MALTEDPILGFLEPNVNPPEGEGRVSYSVKPKDSLANGTVIRNKAKIIFDVNEPILTNEWKVTIDDAKPMSQILLADSNLVDTIVKLKIESYDPYGEISGYNINQKINSSDFYPIRIGTKDSLINLNIQYDSTYQFYSIAYDYAGNKQDENNPSYLTIKVNNPVITTTPLTKNEWCIGDSIEVNFTTDKVFYYDNKFTLQLSDKNGNFTNFTILDTMKSQTSGEFKCLIPKITEESDKYRVRVVSSSPVIVSNDNGTALNIKYCGVGQRLILSAGWNMISTYIVPDIKDSIQYVYSDLEDNLIIAKNNEGKVYIPLFEINDIGKWNVLESYQIYLNRDDTLAYIGQQLNPETTPIPLISGWNMPAYIRNSPMDAVQTLASISDDENLIIAKDNDGNVYIPMFEINTIGNLIPGQGYQMYVSNDDNLIYPANSLGKATSNNGRNKPNYLLPKYTKTGSNSTLILKAEFAEGSEIGVSNFNDEIVGSGVVQNGIAVITIWGDNTQTKEIDGAVNSYELKVISYELKTGKISDVSLSELMDVFSKESVSGLTYSKDKLFLAKAEVNSNSEISLNIKPNPANDVIEISFTTPDCKNTEINIYSMDGKLIDKIQNLIDNTTTFNVSKFTAGEYTVIMNCGNEKAMRKVVVVR
jgi:hypothetical protein